MNNFTFNYDSKISLCFYVIIILFNVFLFGRQADLYRILKAYSIFNPLVGYCQAQAPIAAALLMHMPAEQAFWCLVSICEKYLPGYYSPGLVSSFISVLYYIIIKVISYLTF